jgi:hypothetical protein
MAIIKYIPSLLAAHFQSTLLALMTMFSTTLLSVAAVVRLIVVLRVVEAQVVIALVGITKHLVAEAQAKLV